MNLEALSDINGIWIAASSILVVLLALVRYFFEKLISRIFKRISLERTGMQLFTRAIILILFNLIVLYTLGMRKSESFTLNEPRTGLIILAVGFGIAILVSLLSFMAIKAGYGGGYESLASVSRLDKGLTLATFALLTGPSEDIFFIGVVQGYFTQFLGWGAIIIYLVLFVAYHYANVLSGVETKKEFMGTLPVRLIVAGLLGISFFLTRTLVWGMIVHNLVDTLSYGVLLLMTRGKANYGLTPESSPPEVRIN